MTCTLDLQLCCGQILSIHWLQVALWRSKRSRFAADSAELEGAKCSDSDPNGEAPIAEPIEDQPPLDAREWKQ